MYPIKAPKYIKQMLTDFHQFHPKKKKNEEEEHSQTDFLNLVLP